MHMRRTCAVYAIRQAWAMHAQTIVRMSGNKFRDSILVRRSGMPLCRSVAMQPHSECLSHSQSHVLARVLACTLNRSFGDGFQHYLDIVSRLAPVIHLSGGWPRWPAPHSRGTLNPKSTWLGYWWGGIEMQSKCALAPPTTQTKPTFLFGWVVRRTASVKP